MGISRLNEIRAMAGEETAQWYWSTAESANREARFRYECVDIGAFITTAKSDRCGYCGVKNSDRAICVACGAPL